MDSLKGNLGAAERRIGKMEFSLGDITWKRRRGKIKAYTEAMNRSLTNEAQWQGRVSKEVIKERGNG